MTLRHNDIGTEHILLGLVPENEGVAIRIRPEPSGECEEHDGVAIRILRDFDADAEKIRNEVPGMLSGPEAGAHAPVTRAPRMSWEASIDVNPSAMVRRLLMRGAARALDDGRSEIEVADLLVALTRDEATSRLLTSLASTSRPCVTRSNIVPRPGLTRTYLSHLQRLSPCPTQTAKKGHVARHGRRSADLAGVHRRRFDWTRWRRPLSFDRRSTAGARSDAPARFAFLLSVSASGRVWLAHGQTHPARWPP